MKYSSTNETARLEIRVLELEDTVAAMASIIGTMTEMLGKVNQIAGHCADTILGVTGSIPGAVERSLPLWPVASHPYGEKDPHRCATGCPCGPE
jgi:hypothetical protein